MQHQHFLAKLYLLNPIRTGGVFHQFLGFQPTTSDVIKGTQSKLGDFSKNLMANKVKVTNFQN